jgi:5-methyltetrahydrofolate--homocysteine methyltransferase
MEEKMRAESEEVFFEEIIKGFMEFDTEKVKQCINKGLRAGMDALSIQEKGLRKALDHLGKLFEKSEVFLPHLVLGAKIFNEGVEILKPHILKNQPTSTLGTAVIGTVFGDLHDLGKNLVALMWSISGFKVIDLGVNVSIDGFIKAVDENRAEILGLSALLTTTMLQQKKVIEALVKANKRDRVKILVGGAPITDTWAEEIGADGYARDAAEAVRVAKQLIK